MMTDTQVDPARFIAMAKRLLARWGHVGTLSRPTTTGPDFNPTAGAPQTSDALMVATDYKAKDIDGTRIRMADKEVYLEAEGLEFSPSTSDTLLEPGNPKPFKIIAVETVRIRTTPIIHVLQCRR